MRWNRVDFSAMALFLAHSALSFAACGLPPFQLTGQVLYWKSLASDSVYVADFNENLYQNTRSVIIAQRGVKMKSLNFEFNPGFRVGVLYPFCSRQLDVSFSWTHFLNHASGSFTPFCQSFLKRRVPPQLKGGFDVNSSACLLWDWADLELAKTCCLTPYISLRAFLGVRGARIDQFFCSRMLYKHSIVDLSFNDNRSLVVDQSGKFRGAGPKVGVDFDRDLFCNLSLFGQAAVSGLVGHSIDKATITFDENLIVPSRAEFTTVDKRHFNLQANRLVTDLALGIRVKPGFKCLNMALSFSGEHHAFFGQKISPYGGGDIPFTIQKNRTEDASIPPFFQITEVSPSQGACNSTSAVFGFVFSAVIEF